MKSTEEDRIFKDILEAIQDSGLETFKASELNDYVDSEITNRTLGEALTQFKSSDLISKVQSAGGSSSRIYSVHSYQNRVTDNLDLKDRKALDEAVNRVLNDEEVKENEIISLLNPYYEKYSLDKKIKKKANVVETTKKLDEISYNLEDKTYSPSK
jgi:hypothetical protein